MSLPFHYENLIGRLDIKPSVDPKDVFLWVHEGSNQAAIHIPNADAPTVAAELLKAAGQEGVFVAKPKDEVRMDRTFPAIASCGYGPSLVHVAGGSDPSELRATAANYIAIAEYIENKAERETEAAKKLQERRDALANELSGGMYTYTHVAHSTEKAIDRIIEMEQAQ